MSCAPCCGFWRSGRPSPPRSCSMRAHFRAAWKAGHGRVGTDTSVAKAARCIWQWIPLGHLLALHVTAANEQERAQVAKLVTQVQEITGEHVELAYADEGCTGEDPAASAQAHGIELEVVRHSEPKRGFVLLPKRWVVERSFAWRARFCRLARDYERLPVTLAGLHFITFACLMLTRLFAATNV